MKVYRPKRKRDGTYAYPKRFTDGFIQKLLRSWAGDRCECCGASGADSLLHVHHLTWLAKHDCTFQNLLVCCVSCHTVIHNHGYQRGKPWTLTPTPEWMTVRGILNPADESVILPVRDRVPALMLLFLLGIIRWES